MWEIEVRKCPCGRYYLCEYPCVDELIRKMYRRKKNGKPVKEKMFLVRLKEDLGDRALVEFISRDYPYVLSKKIGD